MEILDSDQHQKAQKKHSTLIIVLSILTIVGSLIQGLYVWIQINAASVFINLSDNWPGNIDGNSNSQEIIGFSDIVNIYKFRLIGDYIWIGAIVLSLIAAILFLAKRKSGIIFYTMGSVAFIISSILFFLVFGDLSKAFGGNYNPFANLIEILCIICSLAFLFLYSMNYKKHCK
jgi:hypothetical protein